MANEEVIRMLTRLKDQINFEWTDAQKKMDALNVAIETLENNDKLAEDLQNCLEMYKKKKAEVEALKQNQWISCSERLPDMYRTYYLVSLADKKEVDIAYFTKYGTWETFRNDEVEAWMPLPEPYREETE